MRAHVALAIVLAGCAHSGLPPVPSKGGPAWLELTSEHFILRTDLPADEARRLIGDLEDFRRVVVDFAFHGYAKAAAGHSLVIGVRDWDEWAYFGKPSAAGETFLAPPLFQHIAIFAGDVDWGSGQKRATIVQHELTHLITLSVFPNQSRWFAEGIAQYFESTQIDRESRRVTVGRFMTDDVRRSIGRYGLASVDATVGDNSAAVDTPAFYNTALLMVAWLLNERPEQFSEFQREMVKMGPYDAWAFVFARELPTSAFTRLLEGWLDGGRFSVAHFTLDKQRAAFVERRLGDGEVYAIRALLHLVLDSVDGRSHARAHQDLERALQADADNVLANLLTATLGQLPAPERASAIAAAHPDDWLAWLLVILTSKDPEEQLRAIRKACELGAANPAIELPAGACPPAG